MDIVADFNGYYLPNGTFHIKEFSFRSVLPNKRGDYEAIHNVVTPPIISEQSYDSDENFKKIYKIYYDTHGIPWNAGVTNCQFMRTILDINLKSAACIYVRNSYIQNLLTILSEENLNIVCLYDYDYKVDPVMQTHCVHHDNPDHNNCADDNAISMVNWLQHTKLYLPEMRNKYHNSKAKLLQYNLEYKSEVNATDEPPSKRKKI